MFLLYINREKVFIVFLLIAFQRKAFSSRGTGYRPIIGFIKGY